MTEAALGRSKNAEVSFSLDLANKPECLSLSVPQSWLVFPFKLDQISPYS